MGKIIIAGIIVAVIIAAAVVALLMSPLGSIIAGAMGMSSAPPPEGTNCAGDQGCVEALALACEKGYSDLSDESQGIGGFVQIVGRTERGCRAYIRLTEHPDKPAFIPSLEMTCYFDPAELESFDAANINVDEYDCEGPLYDAIKMTQGQ